MKLRIKKLKKAFGEKPFNREYYRIKAELQKQKAKYSPEIIINIMYYNEFKRAGGKYLIVKKNE